MMVSIGYSNMIVIFIAVIVCHSIAYGYELQNNHVVSFESYSLAEYLAHSVTDSEFGCAVECLTQQDTGGGCAAYQWNAQTTTCRTQKTLNVTASDGGDKISVMANAAHCFAYMEADPTSQSGVYYVLVGMQHFRQVWCDMDTDGGGWTVFLKRLDGSVDFYRDLAAYSQGFGDVSGEYWLGLDDLHVLTSSQTLLLRADISDWEGASVHSLYASMAVADETLNYTLSLGTFLGGDGGDGLGPNAGWGFTTKDADRDALKNINCATRHHGGYWYKLCLPCNPTGKYYIGGEYTNNINDGIQWRTWSAHASLYYSMKTVEMKLRP